MRGGLCWAIAIVLAFCTSVARADDQGILVVVTEPAGADVLVDGAAVGTAPIKVPTLPGEHYVEVRLGEASASKTVSVEAGKSVLVQIALEVSTPIEVTPTPVEPPKQTPDATSDAIGDVKPFVIQDRVRSPVHPDLRRRPRQTIGLGLFCPFVSTWAEVGYVVDGGCAPNLRFTLVDWSFGELHLDLFGLGSAVVGGARLGTALGMRYRPVGASTGPLAWAIRLDLGASVIASTMTNDADESNLDDDQRALAHTSILGPALTVEPTLNLAYAVKHHLTIEARVGFGIALGLRHYFSVDPLYDPSEFPGCGPGPSGLCGGGLTNESKIGLTGLLDFQVGVRL